jgi:PTS system mannose-specific IIB component
VSIEIVRIDDRLIHGQIVQGWLKTIHITAILVVSDEVASDQMQQVFIVYGSSKQRKVIHQKY